MDRQSLASDELFKSYQLTWKECILKFFAPLKTPWFWALSTVGYTICLRYINQVEEIHRRYNEIHGRTDIEFNPYDFENKEIYKMLNYLDEKGVKVGDDTVRLSRRIDNLIDRLSFK